VGARYEATQATRPAFLIIADPGAEGRRPVRDDAPGPRRGVHGADRVRGRSQEEDPPDDHVPQTTGRNFDEILRVIDSLQLTDQYKVGHRSTGGRANVIIVPAVTDEEARTRFPKGWRTLKLHLRLTPQPGR
jgi:hypothetical protein